MLKQHLKYVASEGEGPLLVLSIPNELVAADAPAACMAIPLMNRDGGLLLAVPSGYLTPHALLEAMSGEETGLLGPSCEFVAPLLEEDEEGNEVRLEATSRFLAADFSDEVLKFLRPYDPVTDPSHVLHPFSGEHVDSIVDCREALDEINSWLEGLGGVTRANFHSAREEQPSPKRTAAKKAGPKRITTATLASQVEALAAQVGILASQQQEIIDAQVAKPATRAKEPPIGVPSGPRLPDVSAGLEPPGHLPVPKVAQLLGPPPRTRASAAHAATEIPDAGETLDMVQLQQDPMALAIMRQSAALTSLVAHLTTGDPISELSSSSSGPSMSMKGVARREKLQAELAEGTSMFFLQVQQQLHRKLCPSRPLPKTEEDLRASGVTMCAYLEKFGGYRSKPDMGMLMWLLAHCVDAAQAGDFRLVKEHLALTVACVEQAVLDGHWGIAYVLSLLEEPPNHIFSDKPQSISSLGRPFGALVPGPWTAVALSYLKEVELITSKKQEAKSPKAQPKPADPAPQPKTPKFPKRPPKAPAEAQPKAS